MSVFSGIISYLREETPPTLYQELSPKEIVRKIANAQYQLMMNGSCGSDDDIPVNRRFLPDLLEYTNATRPHFQALRGIAASLQTDGNGIIMNTLGGSPCTLWVDREVAKAFGRGLSVSGDKVNLNVGIFSIGGVDDVWRVIYDVDYGGGKTDARQIGAHAAPCYPERVALNNYVYIPDRLLRCGWRNRGKIIQRSFFPMAEWPYLNTVKEKWISGFRVMHISYDVHNRASSMELCERRTELDQMVIDVLKERNQVEMAVINVGTQLIGDVEYCVYTGIES